MPTLMMRAFALLFATFASASASAGGFAAPWRSAAVDSLSGAVLFAVVCGAVVLPLMLCWMCWHSTEQRERRLANLLAVLLLVGWGSNAKLAGTVFYFASKAYCTANSCGAEDGSSEANAFDGTADIAWGSSAGQVGPGDTLCGVGSFIGDAEKHSAAGMLRINNSGTDATSKIKIDGDCANVGEDGYAVLDGNGEVAIGIRAAVSGFAQSKFIEVRNFKIRNFTSRGVQNNNTGNVGEQTSDSDQLWENLIINDIGGIGADLKGGNVEFSRSTIDGCGDDCVYVKGARFKTEDLTVSRPSQSTATGDGLTIETYSDGYIVRRYRCLHNEDDYKQCLLVGGLSDTGANGLIEDVDLTCYPGSTTQNCLLFTGVNATARRVITRGGYYGIGVANVATSDGTRVESSIVLDPAYQGIAVFGSTLPTDVVISHSVVARAGHNGFSIAATTPMTIQNSVALDSGNCGFNIAPGTTTEQHNDSFNNAIAYCGNGSEASAGTGSASVDPGFTGGASPTTAAGFKLRPDSVLKCAGLRTVPRFTDMFGYSSEPGCAPIGAMNYSPAGQSRSTALPPRTTALEAAP